MHLGIVDARVEVDQQVPESAIRISRVPSSGSTIPSQVLCAVGRSGIRDEHVAGCLAELPQLADGVAEVASQLVDIAVRSAVQKRSVQHGQKDFGAGVELALQVADETFPLRSGRRLILAAAAALA